LEAEGGEEGEAEEAEVETAPTNRGELGRRGGQPFSTR